jgi:predicted nucleic acid-binding protein
MIVVDASVIIAMLVDDTDLGGAVRIRLHGDVRSSAPDLINLETLSGLRRLERCALISSDQRRTAVARLSQLDIERELTAPMIRRIDQLRDNVTPYDAAYVALAEALGCPLLTADRRLANAHGPRCDFELI